MKRIYLTIIIITVLLCNGCAYLDKDSIIQLVHDNIDLLNQAVIEIYALDEEVSYIAHSKHGRLGRPDFFHEGVYTVGTYSGIYNWERITKPLDNPILEELLKDGNITSISTRRLDREDIRRWSTGGEIYLIRFSCRSRGIRYIYEGFYYSSNNVPAFVNGGDLGGIIWENPIPYKNGWFELGEISYYYSERITDYWFYYKLVFHMGGSSGRVPDDLPLE